MVHISEVSGSQVNPGMVSLHLLFSLLQPGSHQRGTQPFTVRIPKLPNFTSGCPFTACFGNPFLKTPQFLGPWLKEVFPFLLVSCCFFPLLFVHLMYLNVIVEHFCHQCALYIGLLLYRPHILVNFLPYRYICGIRSTMYNKHDVIGWCKD